MNKQTKLWVFNLAMLAFFIFVVFIPINDGRTLFKSEMDKLMGATMTGESAK